MTPAPRSVWHWLLPIALIAAAVAAAYFPALSGPFVFDDVPSIQQNPTILHLWPVGPVLSPPRGMTVDGRPLLNLSLALSHAWSGFDPRGYRLLNLAIHVLAALVLFGIVRRTGEILRMPGARPFGLAVALLWALHPLQTESVSYIVQRGEAMMGLFYLLTLYCFIRYSDETLARTATEPGTRKRFASIWAAGSISCCLLGMATKEVMVSAPVMVFLYDRTFLSGSFRAAWRRHGGVLLGLAATWFLLGFLVAQAGLDRGGSLQIHGTIAWGSYWLTEFKVIARYLKLAFWPRPLIFDYGVEGPGVLEILVPAIVLVLGLAAATVLALKRRPVWGFLGFWFFAILAPTSLVAGNRQMSAEHRMYLALIPVVILVARFFKAAADRLGQTPRARATVFAILVLAGALPLEYASLRRNRIYASELALWVDTVIKRPTNPFAKINLGNTLYLAGRKDLARTQYEAAVAMRPEDRDARINFGICLLGLDQIDEAAGQLREAVRLDGGWAPARSNLALALSRMGDWGGAAEQYEALVRLNPDDAEARAMLKDARRRANGPIARF